MIRRYAVTQWARPQGRATGFFDDALVVFARDATTGVLSFVESVRDTALSRNMTTGELVFVEVLKDGVNGVDGLRGVWSVAVSPDGGHVYAGGILDGSLAVFTRNATTGALGFVQRIAAPLALSGVQSVIVSPGGSHVYAVGSEDYTLVAYTRWGYWGAELGTNPM